MDPISIIPTTASFRMHTRQPSFSRQWSITGSTIESTIGWRGGASWQDSDMMMMDAPYKSSMSMSPTMGSALARSPDSRMDIEEQFCKNYQCCGLYLEDLHELVAHHDAAHSGGSDDSTTSSMSSSPRSSFSAPGTPGPETAPAYNFGEQFDSKLNAHAAHYAQANPAPATPQRSGAMTQPLSSVARTSSWQSYFPTADDEEDIFMSDESVMSMRDRNRARSVPDTTKCLSPSVLTTATLSLHGLSARHSVPSLSSNYSMAPQPQQPSMQIPVPPNMPQAPFAMSRSSVVSIASSSDDEDEDHESSRWAHRSIKAKPSAKPLKEKAYKCPNPECQKSYKNPNGLKYHVTKGTCLVA
ncbi:transcription factor [Ceratobasidium sp. AG-Ba]|nr:transcription factor [Ceratobasidium sp. AG-Ba]